MPMIAHDLNLLCIAGPVEVEEQAQEGTRIDKKTGEEKKQYVKTGKKLHRYFFQLGAESTHFDAKTKDAFIVGKSYRASGQTWFSYLNLNNYTISEIVVGK